ncbi:bacteriocin fulvocin C-related protein [Streptantibioticus parmotrematis]|uniref:bacteriocin fulvocin C-related protein n=1 Tax=Streptantibioticus parmotrematis TaxID=2873249 RepID=UPI0033CE0BE2
MEERWILAFDSSCATCGEISAAVSEACGGRLETLPLSHPEVRGTLAGRQRGGEPSRPALLRVGGTDARVRTGVRMAVPLARRLGVRRSVSVLRALGRLRQDAKRVPFEEPRRAASGVGRGRFLQLAAGAGVAAGVVLLGRTPAIAEQRCATAAAWATRNKDHLPQRYDDIITYPMAYRRAIYAQLPTNARAQCWTEHLKRYRTTELTSRQHAVMDSAAAILATPALLGDGGGAARTDARLEAFHREAVAAFGAARAGALFATLGPAEGTGGVVSPRNTCTCSVADSWCDNATQCEYHPCSPLSSGCGSFWSKSCDGLCWNS